MRVLHSDLYYHPDAARREAVRLGSLMFVGEAEEGTGAACLVTFYPGEGLPLLEAQRSSNDEFFAAIFKDFESYVQYVAEQTQVTPELSEEQIALSFIAKLPQNLRATRPEPWPPIKVMMQAAREQRPMLFHRIRRLSAAVSA